MNSGIVWESSLVQYPKYIPNPTETSYFPKLSVDKANKIFDEFSPLGLELLPKIRTKKFPIAKFWGDSVDDYCGSAAKSEQSNIDVSGWCVKTGNVVVLDFDNFSLSKLGYEPELLYYFIMSMSSSKFVFSTPTGGLHIYYQLPKDKEVKIRNMDILNGLEVRGEGGQVVFYGSTNRYDGVVARRKGVIVGHLGSYSKIPGGEYSSIPYMSEELYNWLLDYKSITKEIEGESYGYSEEGAENVDMYTKVDKDKRLELVIELCIVIMNGWDTNSTYEEWCQFWMSANTSCQGNEEIRDLIINDVNMFWSDGDIGIEKFRIAWDSYRSDTNKGYTISSLFWLAKNSGWLLNTGYEISGDVVEYVDYKYMSDWFNTLDEIPKIVLLESQTGSGKTSMIPLMWSKLNEPKTVIFCPSVKLCVEMTNTLVDTHGMPALCYRDEVDGDIMSTMELLDAEVLVITLQSFVNRLYSKGISVENYELFYFEESDQLLSQFARGGGSKFSSHVREKEAQLGFKVLQESLEKVNYVWFVDATMTQVTYKCVSDLCEDVLVIRNRYITRKSSIEFVEYKTEVYKVMLDYLYNRKKVVVACDTKEEVEFVREFIKVFNLSATVKHIMITRDTARSRKVVNFISNVNEEVLKYDLIVYNSAMGSGVSITSMKPDLIIQFMTYLTPRVNLQILNRFRKQGRVICYCGSYGEFFNIDSIKLYQFIKERVDSELNYLSLPSIEKSKLATLRAEVAVIAVADESYQKRNPKLFYQNLLGKDGRDVIDFSASTRRVDISSKLKEAKEMKNIEKRYISEHWRTVEPILGGKFVDVEYTPRDISLGLAHGMMVRAYRGNVPDGDDKEIYKLGTMFYNYQSVLVRLLKGGGFLGYYEKLFLNRNTAITAYWLDLSKMRLVCVVQDYLWENCDNVLSVAKLKRNADKFISAIKDCKDMFDKMFVRKADKLEAMLDNSIDIISLALAISKKILNLVGLKQRVKDKNKKDYFISNFNDFKRFIELRGIDVELTFSMDDLLKDITDRQDQLQIFKLLAVDVKDEVMELLINEYGMSLKMAVTNVLTNEGVT